jgi:hypothetical protein
MKAITPLLLATILLLVGCATKWQTENEPTPFIAVNQLAVSQSRTVQDLTTLMNPTGERYENRWSNDKKIHIRKHVVMDEIENYFLRTQYYDSLQKSNGHIYHEEFGRLNERINSHRLYLLSLKPTVLLLSPIHYKKPDKLPGSIFGIKDMLGTPSNSVLGFHGLIESIYSGAEIPFADHTLWCAPVAGGEPKPLERMESGKYKISLNECELTLVQTNNLLMVTRTK